MIPPTRWNPDSHARLEINRLPADQACSDESGTEKSGPEVDTMKLESSVSITATASEHGPWNPGISSELPSELWTHSTVFREDNVSTGLNTALEFQDFCGIPAQSLTAFRTERLMVHELLVRITANLNVPDGPNDEDLGVNFRKIASCILTKHLAPHRQAMNLLLTDVRQQADNIIMSELSEFLFAPTARVSPAPKPVRKIFSWLFPRNTEIEKRRGPEKTESREKSALKRWHEPDSETTDSLQRSCFEALAIVITAIMAKRGRVIGDQRLIADMALTFVNNTYGSHTIGEALEPLIRRAAEAEGFRFLPVQAEPVVMNVKGASGAGKSTMRSRQQQLAQRLEIDWADFAVISPDIWRKFLLDYDSLGDNYKYAGTFTGHEIEVIDKKLDRYMARKAASGCMSHLLIDRFRFDSFVPETDGDEASKLLTRFGHLIYMYFMITPPEATVERAWLRGLRVGRFKSVDDLLAHNVEAYTGMPNLFFTWALRTRKRVHYEFLDNSVKAGEQPKTVAFGWNGEMNILDLKRLIDVDRFRKINIDAKTPNGVYPQAHMAVEQNLEFLKQCAHSIPAINLADRETGYIYARLEQGKWAYRDEKFISGLSEDEEVRAALEAFGPATELGGAGSAHELRPLDVSMTHTLGSWGNQKTKRE